MNVEFDENKSFDKFASAVSGAEIYYIHPRLFFMTTKLRETSEHENYQPLIEIKLETRAEKGKVS